MLCKFCGAQLEEDTTLCPSCGKDNAESKPKKLDIKKVIFASVSVVLLLAALIGMLHYGLHGVFFWANDILSKSNYTLTDDQMGDKLDLVVATLGEDKLTNEQLQIYYWMQFYNLGSYYGFDPQKPLNEQIKDKDTGMTWQQYLLETALENWNQYQALVQMANKEGFALPDEYQKTLDELPQMMEKSAADAGFASVDELLTAQFGKGVTLDSYKSFLVLYYTSQLYFYELVDRIEVTDAELETYYETNKDSLTSDLGVKITKESGKLVDVRHILVEVKGTGRDDKGNAVVTDADWETCRAEAQKIYDEWLKGTKDEVTFGDFAYKYSTDGNKNAGGIYTDISKGFMVKEFEDWCFDESRKHGDHGLVKTRFGYHIMFYVAGEEGWKRLCRDGVQTEKADKLLEDILKENVAKINYRKISLGTVDLS